MSVLWLPVTGGVVIAMGGQMPARGQRPVWLSRVVIALVAVFAVAGIVVMLQAGDRLPRLWR
jgi:hypothetical protein